MAFDSLEAAIRHARARFGDPVLFLGSSMGGIIGWSLLTRAPDIAGAVLHGIAHPAVTINRSDAVKYPLTKVLGKLAPHAPVPVGQIGDFGAVAAHPLSVEYFASRPERISCWTVSARSMGSLLALQPQIDWSELTIPAMVVIGGEDRMLPPDYTRQCFESSRLPGAELRVLPGAGHLLTHDSLPQLLDAVVPFFAEAGQPAPAASAMRP
jgi:pimeloyl-ACP methyl ester carboxylesterase